MICLEQPSAPYLGYTYPEPLGKYVAAWDRSLVQRRLHADTPRLYAKAVWNFFSRFPGRREPGSIFTTDVVDYIEVREEQVAWNTLRREVSTLRAFYSWMIRELGLELANPFISLAPERVAQDGERIRGYRR